MKTLKKIRSFLLVCVVLGLTVVMYSQQTTASEKTLQHVIVFQWTENTDQEVKAEIIKIFTELPGKIKGMESFEIHDIISSTGDFDNILRFKFKSENALKIYDEHPDHEKVKKMMPHLVSGYASYDYWN